MTNAKLIAKLNAGTATEADKRLYERRVNSRLDANACVHGHFNCAIVERGPCSDEHRPQEESES